MRFSGQTIGFIAGSAPDGKTLVYRLPHGDLSKAPRLGDLLIVCDTTTNHRWLVRVESYSHVSIELHEQEVRNAIARGQTSLGAELSDHEKEMYLGHDYHLRILGELRDNLVFAPVARILPPRGAAVMHLTAEQLKQLVTLDADGAHVGYYAVGDEVFNSNSNQIPVKFSVKRFVSRRSAIFGIAGFGKSNLMKNVIAQLTIDEPTVGKLIFDLDGEYAFGSSGTDKSYGLADIPGVTERLVVYTYAKRTEAEYQSVTAGNPILNLGDLSPRKVVSALLPESRQDRVYADLLKAMSSDKWKKILLLVGEKNYETDPNEVATILGIPLQENLPSINGMIRALIPMIKGHSSDSNMLRDVLENLKLGATIIIDLSGMSLDAAFNLTTFMIDELFEANQDAFTAGGIVPEVVVFVEEAQNLLSDRQIREGNPLVRLAKEGRKYNLGLVYVSQQPGAIAKEVLTQTNTFLVLHLLSKVDLKALQDVNPHYDGVVGDFIQLESLQGHAYIYSTVPNMPTQSYVFATKASSFSDTVKQLRAIPPKGTMGIKRLQEEISSFLAEILKTVLASQTPTAVNGDQKYQCSHVSLALAKQLKAPGRSSNIDQKILQTVLSTKRPDFVDNSWIVRGCEKLGFAARIEWEDQPQRGYYLYLHDSKTQPPQVKRPIS